MARHVKVAAVQMGSNNEAATREGIVFDQLFERCGAPLQPVPETETGR